MKLSRRAFPLAVLALSVAAALPASALATPSVSAPSTASLATGKPVFTITASPTGSVTAIVISRTNKVSSTGALQGGHLTDRGERINVQYGMTTATTTSTLFAGLHYFNYVWYDTPSTGVEHITALSTFVVPAYIRAAKVKGTPYQNPKTPQFGALGTFSSNVIDVKYSCEIKQGAKRIARKRSNAILTVVGTGQWDCRDMKVPEKLDGKRLKLVVTFTSGKAKSVLTKPFTAK